MRTILLIATGGTIASRPTAAGGLAPAITSQELLSCVPELAEFCRIDAIQLYNLDSTNMGPEQCRALPPLCRKTMTAMMVLSSPMARTRWLYRRSTQLHDTQKPQAGGADRQPEIDL